MRKEGLPRISGGDCRSFDMDATHNGCRLVEFGSAARAGAAKISIVTTALHFGEVVTEVDSSKLIERDRIRKLRTARQR